MANEEQLTLLKQGVEGWNLRRIVYPNETIDLGKADLSKADLHGVNLRQADLHGANLSETKLNGASLNKADLLGAVLHKADLQEADLQEADLSRADLRETNLRETKLSETKLSGADLCRADLYGADLYHVKIDEATQIDAKWKLVWELMNQGGKQRDLHGADLSGANLRGTNLSESDLRFAQLSLVNLVNATLTGACMYGTARDDWQIQGIICKYVFWDKEGKERTPKDRDFRSGEFEELYKQLPTFEYFFEHGFTLIDEVVMNRIVEGIKQRHSEFELDLVSFDKRSQPHATFTVLHKEYAAPALQQITADYLEYEKRIATLEGKLEGKDEQILAQKLLLSEVIEKTMDKLLTRPQFTTQALQMFITETLTTQSIGGHNMNGTKQIFGDNFESGGGNQNIAQGQATANQTNYTVAQPSSVKELLQLLAEIQQDISKLPLAESVKAEALNEVKGAEIQAQKPTPDKPKIADRLKNAVAALKEAGALGAEAVGLGTALGQAFLWCGEHWAF